jgi:hypothetical protein
VNLGNTAGIFRQPYVYRILWLSLGLLGGCSHAVRKAPAAPPATTAAVDIGVPTCNAYLNRYLACHRAAHIFPADSLDGHYQAMLSSLRQGANDPSVRPYLSNRCLGLTQQLDAALQGRPCLPPSPSTTPARPQN